MSAKILPQRASEYKPENSEKASFEKRMTERRDLPGNITSAEFVREYFPSFCQKSTEIDEEQATGERWDHSLLLLILRVFLNSDTF